MSQCGPKKKEKKKINNQRTRKKNIIVLGFGLTSHGKLDRSLLASKKSCQKNGSPSHKK